ncbi:MAG: hypothetical protein NDI82_06290 [Anaeromyxobacteraceae bacterium]|nr:hypothetical protein [Anaeromyxobacteraceae bacterium]
MLMREGPVNYSPAKLRDVIGVYSRRYREAKDDAQRDGLIPSVTDPESLDPGGERLRIYPPDSTGAFEVEYDMPLDGEWSDLTAQFTFRPHSEGYLGGLYDIHVL